LRSLAEPITRAPRRSASCTASWPTPPAAPLTKMVSPGRSSSCSTPSHAVRPATTRLAATAGSSPAGMRASRSTAGSTTVRSWSARVRAEPKTRSPTAHPSTSGPTSSIVPAMSLPTPSGGRSPRAAAAGPPLKIFQSTGFSAAASTRTRTSPRPACGSSASRSSSTSGSPNRSCMTRRMRLTLLPPASGAAALPLSRSGRATAARRRRDPRGRCGSPCPPRGAAARHRRPCPPPAGARG